MNYHSFYTRDIHSKIVYRPHFLYSQSLVNWRSEVKISKYTAEDVLVEIQIKIVSFEQFCESE